MSKTFKICVLVLLFAGVTGFGLPKIFQSSAQEAKSLTVEEKVLPKITDKDKNKIFDNLEELIKGQPEEAFFDTIVLFEENLSESLFEKTRGKIGNFSIKYQYPSISGIATTLTKGQIIALSKIPFIKQIEDDAKVEIFLDKATFWFGVQKARTDFGVDGNKDGLSSYSKDDIVIAIIDTGIDPNHVDLDGGKIIGWKDIVGGKLNPYDDNGHGTHVSSIAAGEGQANPLYKGVAPGAALVGVKVLDKRGSGTVSGVNAGVQWVIDNKTTYGIEIFNMSLGIAGCSDGTDSTSLVVNKAVDPEGLVGVVAAGNEGPAKCTIGSPAAAAKAITVGAMADLYPGGTGASDLPARGFYQAYFSSRGPTYDGRIKPDISAPGVRIMAAKTGTTNGYIEYSGTSMSSPFVAGLAGLILQANPSLTSAQIKSKLAATAIDWDALGSDIDYGAGRLDGYEALKSAGGFTGTNIATPEHKYQTGYLSGTGDADWYEVNVTNTSYPIAVTLIIPDWAGGSPDFDVALYDNNNNPLFSCAPPPGSTAPCVCIDDSNGTCKSRSVKRQETLGYQPPTTGIYKIRVNSYSGSGNYFFDQSAGTAVAVSITLITNGTTPFGILALGAVKDTTPSGTNDVQTVQVTTGPANLSVKSTNFSDGANTWTLGASNGANQVKWEFSKDAAGWNTFSSADALFSFDTNVAQGATRDLYLKLTMPTSTLSNNEYGATVTIMATAPSP